MPTIQETGSGHEKYVDWKALENEVLENFNHPSSPRTRNNPAELDRQLSMLEKMKTRQAKTDQTSIDEIRRQLGILPEATAPQPETKQMTKDKAIQMIRSFRFLDMGIGAGDVGRQMQKIPGYTDISKRFRDELNATYSNNNGDLTKSSIQELSTMMNNLLTIYHELKTFIINNGQGKGLEANANYQSVETELRNLQS